MFEEITEKMEAAIRVMVGLIERGYALCGTASGGKDSGCASILMLEAVRRVAAAGRPQADHFITSANTTIENPSLLSHLDLMLVEIGDWAAEQALPVTVHVATPSLAAQFVVSTIGRGTLVRTPENGVRDGKRIRPCADSWKVQPQLRLLSSIKREATGQGSREVVTILGNRLGESRVRGTAMLARGESAIEPVRSASGDFSLSPLFDWSTDVWTMLGLFSSDHTRPFPTAVSPRSIERMTDLYRAVMRGPAASCLASPARGPHAVRGLAARFAAFLVIATARWSR